MRVIFADTVDDALWQGVLFLQHVGVRKPSRAGDTLEVPGPVMTVYGEPTKRVLSCPVRNANPFFHLFEALWILGGSDQVKFLTQFNKRMGEYSDDGKRFHAAYGFRLRGGEERNDQIATAIQMLSRDPTTRRVVLQIWDSELDLGTESKDIPCNDMVFLKVRDGALDMTVCCRSNDMLWGAYGANAVQFSMIQEYIAVSARLQVGQLFQLSDSLHVYTSGPGGELWNKMITTPRLARNPYRVWSPPHSLFAAPAHQRLFDADIRNLLDGYDHLFVTPFFKHIVAPMLRAWYHRNDKEYAREILDTANLGRGNDWLTAGRNYLSPKEITP